MDSESEDAGAPTVKPPRPTRIDGPAQNGMSSGTWAFRTTYVVPLAPVESVVLPLRQTDIGNGITDRLLSAGLALRSRCQPYAAVSRIVEEANAFGKAERYADVDTLVGKAGTQVGVQRS
jgi:hypothetical protein